MQLAKSPQKTKYKCHKCAAFSWTFFDFRGKIWKQDFCFLEQGKVSKSRLLQYKISVKIAQHTKAEKKMLTKM